MNTLTLKEERRQKITALGNKCTNVLIMGAILWETRSTLIAGLRLAILVVSCVRASISL